MRGYESSSFNPNQPLRSDNPNRPRGSDNSTQRSPRSTTPGRTAYYTRHWKTVVPPESTTPNPSPSQRGYGGFGDQSTSAPGGPPMGISGPEEQAYGQLSPQEQERRERMKLPEPTYGLPGLPMRLPRPPMGLPRPEEPLMGLPGPEGSAYEQLSPQERQKRREQKRRERLGPEGQLSSQE